MAYWSLGAARTQVSPCSPILLSKHARLAPPAAPPRPHPCVSRGSLPWSRVCLWQASGCGPKTHTGLTLSLASRALPAQTRARTRILGQHLPGWSTTAGPQPSPLPLLLPRPSSHAFPSAPLSEQSATVTPLASSGHSVDLAQTTDRPASLGEGRCGSRPPAGALPDSGSSGAPHLHGLGGSAL